MACYMYMIRTTLFLVLVAAVAPRVCASEPAIPFPEALDAAEVSQARIDSVTERALLLGNGDINALLYSDSGNVLLRLTKNDVWDARLDTSEDPPLLPIKRIKELAEGEWLKGGSFGGGWLNPDGTPRRGPNSWSREYPCPRPCAVVKLGEHPNRPTWRQIREEGEHNAWQRHRNVTVMSIRGRKGASNGYAYGPLDFTTEEYSSVRVRLSGSGNARYFVDVMGPGNGVIVGSKWIESPTQPAERVFQLPPDRKVNRLIFYTWTEDGKRAENRFEAVTFEGPKGKLAVDLTATPSPSCAARLDIRRAVARVIGGTPQAEVRALAQRNVFLIESPAPALLSPVRSSVIPPATLGRRDGVEYLHQKLPADADWPGMSFAVALAQDGKRKAVAIVTSHESKEVIFDAVRLAQSTLRANLAELVREHEAAWERFWSASGIDIEDALLRDAWYRNLYFLRCVSKAGVQCVGLYAGLVHDGLPAWHGGHTTNYNAEQTFWSGFPTNHTELTEPYERLVSEYLPRARWLCRQLFDCEGAYYPHNLFNYEPPHPEKCRSRIGRQQFYVTWSYTIGVSGFTVQNLWLRYKYQPDREYLERIAYPAVRDVATFYANYINQCEAADNGKVVLAPSVSPEHWGWTHKFARNRNCAFDIAFARYTLQAAIEGATTLRTDAKLVARFREALERLPAYPTTKDAPPIVVDVADALPITYNIAVPAVPVFPGDVVTWWSPPEEKELFARTISQIRWNGNNSTFILSVARARLSMADSYQWLRDEVKHRLRPNGTLTLNRLGNTINNHGHYTEQFAASMAVSELLIQSVGDIIRLFPAWPKEKGARFRSLRTQGGFLVSAEQKEGKINLVKVTATVGGRLRLLSPWPGIAVRLRDGKQAELKPDARGIVELDTRPGEQMVFQRQQENRAR